MSKLNLDEYENIIIYKSLTDSGYLASIADIVKPEYFKNKSIASIFEIVKDFNEKRNKLPTVTEIKTYLVTDEQKAAFKQMSCMKIQNSFLKRRLSIILCSMLQKMYPKV